MQNERIEKDSRQFSDDEKKIRNNDIDIQKRKTLNQKRVDTNNSRCTMGQMEVRGMDFFGEKQAGGK